MISQRHSSSQLWRPLRRSLIQVCPVLRGCWFKLSQVSGTETHVLVEPSIKLRDTNLSADVVASPLTNLAQPGGRESFRIRC